MIQTNTILTVVTRTHSRHDALSRCIDSVDRCRMRSMIEHRIILDNVGVGIGQAQMFIKEVTEPGLYVLVLDDDDVIVNTDLVPMILSEATASLPGAIFTKMDHGAGLGILPPAFDSPSFPSRGRVGVSCPIVRYDVFEKAKFAFRPFYDGDYDYVSAVCRLAETKSYWDLVITKTGAKQ